LDGLAQAFSKQLNSVKGTKVLECAELTERVRAIISRIGKEESQSQDSEFTVISCINREEYTTLHSFKNCDAIKLISNFKKSKVQLE
jgi:hypothetical protein